MKTLAMIEKLCAELGDNVTIQVGTRKWLVQRHYIALHGIEAQRMPYLGFPEIGPETFVTKS